MKKTLLLASLVSLTTFCYSQTEQFKKGQIDAQLGFGFVSTANANLNAAGLGEVSKYRFAFPPPYASLDYAVTDEISLGGYLTYTSANVKFYDSIDKEKVMYVGARGLYHIDVHPKLDTYGGAGLAFGSYKGTTTVGGHTYNLQESGKLYYQLIVGSRYRFTEDTGAFLEIGYGIALFNIGINFKL